MTRRAPPLIALDDATPPHPPAGARADSVLVVGNFDGVHRGHQAVLDESVAEARARGLSPAVLTFDPHPSVVLAGAAPLILTTVRRRAELMVALGIERVYVRHFDASFAQWSPERFVVDLVASALSAKLVLVGENFRFGAKRAGDLALLRAMGAKLGFETRVHGLARDEGGAFSSTRARMCIAAGDVEAAADVLGRPHALSGIVGHGAKRGRTIGFPTANLEQVPEMLPAYGVYAVEVEFLDSETAFPGGIGPRVAGVMNVGVRPTVGDRIEPTVEAHLLDYAGDLYGAALRVHLIARVREERRFSSVDALKAQIALDTAAARARLSRG